MRGRNTEAFLIGAGTPPEKREYTCSECGHTSTERRHFKGSGEEKTCATGHYEKDGELHRARNPYARR